MEIYKALGGMGKGGWKGFYGGFEEISKRFEGRYGAEAAEAEKQKELEEQQKLEEERIKASAKEREDGEEARLKQESAVRVAEATTPFPTSSPTPITAQNSVTSPPPGEEEIETPSTPSQPTMSKRERLMQLVREANRDQEPLKPGDIRLLKPAQERPTFNTNSRAARAASGEGYTYAQQLAEMELKAKARSERRLARNQEKARLEAEAADGKSSEEGVFGRVKSWFFKKTS